MRQRSRDGTASPRRTTRRGAWRPTWSRPSRAFEALRGTLVFEDEPSSFEAALHDDEGVSAMTDLADLSLVEAADAVRNGEATSIDLLDACWRNLEAANPAG